MVIIIDDDLIKYLDHEGYGATKAYGCIINNIMIEHGRVLQAHKEYLPVKCRKADYLKIIWIEPLSHDGFHNNQDRYKFNNSLTEMAKFHEEVLPLPL